MHEQFLGSLWDRLMILIRFVFTYLQYELQMCCRRDVGGGEMLLQFIRCYHRANDFGSCMSAPQIVLTDS
jgi:hypothetical protein